MFRTCKAVDTGEDGALAILKSYIRTYLEFRIAGDEPFDISPDNAQTTRSELGGIKNEWYASTAIFIVNYNGTVLVHTYPIFSSRP